MFIKITKSLRLVSTLGLVIMGSTLFVSNIATAAGCQCSCADGAEANKICWGTTCQPLDLALCNTFCNNHGGGRCR